MNLSNLVAKTGGDSSTANLNWISVSPAMFDATQE